MTTPSQTPIARRSTWEVQRSVISALLLREIRARVDGQWIGAVWTLVEPLAHMVFMVGVFGFLAAPSLPGVEYPVFLVTGLVPFFLFQHLSFRLMDGIDANRGLFSYRQVKPLDVLASRGIVETLMNLIVYAVSLGVLAWLGYHVLPVRPLEALAINALLIFLGMGWGILCAVISHERPRLRSLLRIVMLPLYMASGVIFPLHSLPPEYQGWLLLNPVAQLIDLSRWAFLPGYTPLEDTRFAYPLMFALGTGAFAMALYRTNRMRLIAAT